MNYQVSLKRLLIFEFKSWLGRKYFNFKPRLKSGKNYLNLGCGTHIVDGYINANFFSGFNFLKKNRKSVDWMLDLRFPLNCADSSFDGIYSEHTFEHLYPEEVKKLLSELYRILKSNAKIRITVPDIEKYVDFYNGNYKTLDYAEFEKRFSTGCSAIRSISQNYFHTSLWDYSELKRFLEDAGFINVKRMSFGVSDDEKLQLDLSERAWETLYVEAEK